MSSIRAPGLGPIVGHTTDTTCRLWIRAGDPQDDGASLSPERRTIGIIAVIEKDRRAIRKPYPTFYFRLHREFDRTGTFNLGEDVNFRLSSDDGVSEQQRGKPYPLEPDSTYRVRMGTLTLDDPFSDDETVDAAELIKRLPAPKVWGDELDALNRKRSEAVFRTFPDGAQPTDSLSFIVGSCRYPGLLWKIKHADRIFGPLRKETKAEGRGGTPRFVLMVGDQIYADKLHRLVPIGRADTFEEFQERYLSAFGSRNMRNLLRKMPTYMILDDHEIEDNWTQDRIDTCDKRALFNIAINAYMSYQWSHGPRNFGNRLFYRFACGGYPFFVADTRTQRFMDDIENRIEDNHLLGRPCLDENEPGQLEQLLHWLEAQDRNIPKFIVTSSVFVPNPVWARQGGADNENIKRKEKSDSWPAFPTTRRTILRAIVDNGIQNVIFISGDIHCSNLARMTFSGTPEAEALRAYSITSSAFYWPFSFADGEPSNFVHDSQRDGQEDSFSVNDKVTMDYTAWNFTQEDNYCRVDVDRANHSITVQAFDTVGKPIPAQRTRELDMAPW